MMKKLIVVVLTIGTVLSCSSDDDNPTNSEILGKWKLIEVQIIDFGTNPTIDYSTENIVYNFQAYGVLSVTGGANIGYPNSTYNYILEEDFLGGTPSPGEEMIWLVKVNSTKWTYNNSNGQMILGTSYVDGPDLTFERLE